MDAWMAFVSIIAIVAIVVIAGGIIAFLGHMIIGVFDKDRQTTSTKTETLDYSQYKQLDNTNSKINEYDFSTINLAKAQKEKEEVQKSNDEEIFKLLENNDSDDDIKEIEERLKNQEQSKSVPAPAPVVNTTEEESVDEDLNSLIDEISGDVVDEEKDRINEENSKTSMLAKYNIDDILNDMDNDEEEEEVVEEPVEDEIEEGHVEPVAQIQEIQDNSEELEKANQEIEDLKRLIMLLRTEKTSFQSRLKKGRRGMGDR